MLPLLLLSGCCCCLAAAAAAAAADVFARDELVLAVCSWCARARLVVGLFVG